MPARRLHVLIDDERLERLRAEAARRQVSVAALVRAAIDAPCPPDHGARREAAAQILAAPPMPVPEAIDLVAEIDAIRGRC